MTRLESVVPGVELGIVLLRLQDLSVPVCDVLVVSSRLLLVVFLRPR